MRPIKPEDASLLLELADSMSRKSRYYRFFTPNEALSPEMLDSLTQIDYDRHITLVALQKEEGKEKMPGVDRDLGFEIRRDGHAGDYVLPV